MKLKVICSWCFKHMGWRPAVDPKNDGKISHSICPACYAICFPGFEISPAMKAEWQALADSLKG